MLLTIMHEYQYIYDNLIKPNGSVDQQADRKVASGLTPPVMFPVFLALLQRKILEGTWEPYVAISLHFYSYILLQYANTEGIFKWEIL